MRTAPQWPRERASRGNASRRMGLANAPQLLGGRWLLQAWCTAHLLMAGPVIWQPVYSQGKAPARTARHEQGLWTAQGALWPRGKTPQTLHIHAHLSRCQCVWGAERSLRGRTNDGCLVPEGVQEQTACGGPPAVPLELTHCGSLARRQGGRRSCERGRNTCRMGRWADEGAAARAARAGEGTAARKDKPCVR